MQCHNPPVAAHLGESVPGTAAPARAVAHIGYEPDYEQYQADHPQERDPEDEAENEKNHACDNHGRTFPLKETDYTSTGSRLVGQSVKSGVNCSSSAANSTSSALWWAWVS
jgi:hypothetical protein